nr:CooT family nickel-binding protein [Ammonifex degensii]
MPGLEVKGTMCEANAYLRNGDKEELILEAVDKVRPFDDGLLLEDIYGRRKFIRAKIKELALVDHKIILERE